MAYIERKEKWIRIVTSIGALYLDSCLHGAIVPLVANWHWAVTESAVGVSTHGDGEDDVEVRASLAVAAIFLATGVVEVCLSPFVGMLADRSGFDTVVLVGLVIATLKCLLLGCLQTTAVVVLAARVLQGIVSSCIQTVAMGRVRDVYDQATAECANVMAAALCKIAFNYFAGLITGELYRYLKHRVFMLFLPVALLLAVGIIMTFRTTNFHSMVDKDEQAKTKIPSSGNMEWRVVLDTQLMIISLLFLVSNLGQSALEPSFAIWMKSAFGAGPASSGWILGLCGLAIILANATSAQLLSCFNGWTWIFCIATLCVTGLSLVLVGFSQDLPTASLALATYFIGATATRYCLVFMGSTIAILRYPAAYGMVFAMMNMGWAGSFLIGPLIAQYLFGPYCGICMIGGACIISSVLCVRLRQFGSNHDGYQVIVTNDKVPFKYDIAEVTLQPNAGTK